MTDPTREPSFKTGRFRCQKCGREYILALGTKATAPHGPNKDCTSQAWEYIADN